MTTTRPTPDTSIRPGDRVRSHDFPDRGVPLAAEGREACYIEGVVELITDPTDPRRSVGFNDCPRYMIRAERRVWCGEERAPEAAFVYPPVNGTPTWGDPERPTFGVEKIEGA